ncbi:MAG: amino acid--tRNA ligase-related protein, partial [Bacteriovoracaceae bacterium]
TQLDIEMSFVDSDDIINLLEELMIEMLKSCYPNKKVKTPFEKLTWQESMKKHKSDKPDLRKNKDDKDELAFAWIIDFPLFERDEENKLTSLHHPFTSFYKEDEKLLESNPVAVRSHAFDLVLNGTELGSGSIRIHDPKTQETIFKMLGISDNEIQNRFGHLLRAFKYGVPPHGGMAWGLDRLLMILQGEESVREVIAFPKTQEGKDLMMEAPTVIEEKQLREAHIKIREK